jgi:hypothetical protein
MDKVRKHKITNYIGLYWKTLNIYLITYSQSWALLEKLPIVQLLKNFPAF